MQYDFWSVVLGAAITGITSIITALISKRSAIGTSKAQMQRTVMQEHFSHRLAAFQGLMQRDIDMQASNYSTESINAFVSAVHAACIVVNEDTFTKLLDFSAAATTPGRPNYAVARAEAVKAMRRDLWVYNFPTIRKTRRFPRA